MTQTYHIDFEPVGRRGESPAGQDLLESARQMGVDLVNICGGAGTCGRCKVQILEGEIPEPTDKDIKFFSEADLAAGYRLACRVVPQSNLKVRVPAESLTTPQRTQVEGIEVPVEPEPPVRVYSVELEPSWLEDLRADWERLAEALAKQYKVTVTQADLWALRQLSPTLRADRKQWRARAAVRGDELIGVLKPEAPLLGLAVDLGTTKVAGYMLDLETGATLASRGKMNPQIAYGEDVIARQDYAIESEAGAEKMSRLVIDTLNEMIVEMCTEIGAQPADVLEAVVVANTAMHHLMLRLPVKQLANAPYIPNVQQALDLKARDLGLEIAPGGYLHLLPNIAGYVGADHVAMILATEVYKVTEGAILALDIGTNTEVCLANNGTLTSLSCASGPAFEGAHIRHGMRAASGAIERVRIRNGQVEYQTIGNTPAVGICGSGILDTLAQLADAGVVQLSGRMNADHPRVRGESGEREFVLVSADEQPDGRAEVTFTQKDVRELQLAKGAIRTGVDALLESQQITMQDVDQVLIAGAFGSYIDVESAIRVGMLPSIPLERVDQVGNAAGMGAKLALISMTQRRLAQEFAARVRYIELATQPNFSQLFAQSMYVGEAPQSKNR